LLQLQNGAKSFGSRQLFEGATFSVNENEHIGVIGPNGAGKTTLFKLIANEIELDHGEIVRARKLSLGYLRQHDSWDESQILENYLETGTKTPIWDLKKLGLSLGLDESLFQKPLKALSGGYKMRAKLLHLLGQEPNLMMLDEPTNYLDLETLLVLEEFLQNYQGAFLLISHDREFLRRTTDHILEIESGDFVKYSGNIDDYFEQKQMIREQLEKKAMSDANRRKEILDFAARFGAKASKARQAQSRLKRLEKMEAIELKPLPVSEKIRIPTPQHTGRIAVELADVDVGYAEKIILQNVDLKIESKDRIGVVGYNGAGKSTLLKAIAKELSVLHGNIEYGYQVRAAYYAQHVGERLKPDHTVIESLSEAASPDIRTQEILDLAGSLLFSGDHMKKKISVLSGGEKARIALGRILLQRAPLLLLDEPTNHLDFYTVESLTQALENYPGTLVVVSHDRGFVRRVATKILEVKSGNAPILDILHPI
jgi:ATP-binding cassette subfamily F protein 3